MSLSLTERFGRRAARKSKTGGGSLQAGLTGIAVLLGFSLFARFALPDPNTQSLSDSNLPPLSPDHPFGTDVLGRDLFIWCANGIATSLLIGILVVLISGTIGTLVGAFAGYVGRWLDAVLMRLVDLQQAVPPLLIFLAASMMIERSVTSMVLLLSSVGWVPYARLVRSNVLVARTRGYVAAARLAGARRTGILLGHMIPASATPIVVFASLQIGFVILSEGALSFLGLGLEPPTASLGYMIAQGKDQLIGAWWIATVPGLVLVLMIVSINLIGDGLRDRFHGDTGGVS
jgi:peptide/nickel transport system permease protein